MIVNSINQLRDFSSLFSRSEAMNWFKEDFESVNVKLARYQILEKYKGKTYLCVLKETYKVLRENYPNEYILKNEFLNQWLRKSLGTQNSVIFNEFRLGKAIADLAMFNGNSKVFEIKTILDKEYRLSNQILEYKKIFNEVYVIVPLELTDKYIEFDKEIGIIAYDIKSKCFEPIRESCKSESIDVNVLMQVLHTNEYLYLAKSFYRDALPQMTSFNQFNLCKELFKNIPQKYLNDMFILLMKKRKIHNDFFNKRNIEFNQICLSLNLSKFERNSMLNKLQTNIL